MDRVQGKLIVSREHLINAPLLKSKLTHSNFGFLCSTAKCQCKVAARERKNCGPPGISAAACRKAGCCFNASVPGVPWCFTAKPKKGNTSTRNTNLPSVCLYRNMYSQGAARSYFRAKEVGANLSQKTFGSKMQS